MTYRSNTRLGWLTGTMLGLGLIALGVPGRVVSGLTYAVEKGRIQANSDQLTGPQEVANSFRMVAKVAQPGVVQIKVTGGERERTELVATENERRKKVAKLNELLQRGDADPQEVAGLTHEIRALEEKRDELLEKLGRGTGSGIVFDTDGHILTNNHVVADRGTISVRLHDGREFEASIVGIDPKTDLALLKIPTRDTHPLNFGNSDEMEVGDWVLAVGAPFGLSQSVTHGIVSAKGRHDIATGREIFYQDFIQTDAAINPGNSGGPLMNIRGEVVGVNTAIASDGTGVNAGVAFTIPSNMARKIAEQLKTGGSVARGWLGVTLEMLDKNDVEMLGLRDDRGAMVNVLYTDSPGHKAGLQCEDVILAVNGKRCDSIRALQAAIADVTPGQDAKLTVVRDGREQDVQVRVDAQPTDVDAFVRGASPIVSRQVAPLALDVRSLTPTLPRELFRWTRNEAIADMADSYKDRKGAFIVEVAGTTRTGAYNLAPGELVISANDTPIASSGDLMNALDSARTRDALRLQVIDPEGQLRTVDVRLK